VVANDHYEEARVVLDRVHGHRDDDFATLEFAEISAQLAMEQEQRQGRSSFMEIFTRKYLRRTLLAIFILQMTKLSGSAIVNNYQSLFYSGLGYKGRSVLLLAGIYGFMGVIGQIINLLWISDKWSRRLTVCKLFHPQVVNIFPVLIIHRPGILQSGRVSSSSYCYVGT